MLEAVDPVIAGQGAHGLVYGFVPPGDGHMEGVIRRRLLGPAAPGVIGLHDVLLGAGDDEIDDHGGAADHAGGGAREEILRRHGAHEGQFHMGVGVDPAGHHITAAGVDHLGPGGDRGGEYLFNLKQAGQRQGG